MPALYDLLHFPDANGTTTFPNAVPGGDTWSVCVGGSGAQNTDAFFGGFVANIFPGNTARYLAGGDTTTDGGIKASGSKSHTGTFCHEFWMRSANVAFGGCLWSMGDRSSSTSLSLWQNTDGKLHLENGSTTIGTTAAQATFNATNHAIAVLRNSSNQIKVCVDGAVVLTVTLSGTISGVRCLDNCAISGAFGDSHYALRQDEYRSTDGDDRYTSFPYTPTSTEFVLDYQGIALAAAAQAQTTLTGALSTSIRFAGAPQAVTTLSGALSTSIRFTAAASAVATLTGGLTTAIRLAASPAAVTTLTGALSTGKPLAGGAQSVVTLAGALSTSIPLAAAPAAVTTLTGALSTAIRFQGAATSVVTLTANLTGGSVGLQGAAAAQTTLSGALSTAIRLAGSPAGQVTLSGALSTSIRAAGAVSSVVTLAGALTTAKPLAGAVLSQATASGTLSTPTAAALAGAVSCVCTVTASLTGGTAATGGTGKGFEIGGGRQDRRRAIPERNFKPLLQRILEARYPRVKPPKERAAKRAKAIENQAAQLIADDPYAVQAFRDLMARWAAEGPTVPPGLDLGALFEAQVGFRLRQMALEGLARQALHEQRARDEEDSLIALLLA